MVLNRKSKLIDTDDKLIGCQRGGRWGNGRQEKGIKKYTLPVVK